ncbi:hypothetical protein Trydic_g9622 [Trypoxylus dichotomus]
MCWASQRRDQVLFTRSRMVAGTIQPNPSTVFGLEISLASDHVKPRYDKKANSSGLQIGEKVSFYQPLRKKKRSPKLEQKYTGPYAVIKRINNLVYRTHLSPRTKLVSLGRLMPLIQRILLGVTKTEKASM